MYRLGETDLVTEDKLHLAASAYSVRSGIGSTQDAQFKIALDAETFEQRQYRSPNSVH
jgi:hypothetical protein